MISVVIRPSFQRRVSYTGPPTPKQEDTLYDGPPAPKEETVYDRPIIWDISMTPVLVRIAIRYACL